MLQRLRTRVQRQEGFTLIELLVVILIIGILAAVAIPTFLSQKGKAQDANAQSNLSTIATAEATYNTSNNGYAPSISALETIEPAITQFASNTAYAVAVTSGSGQTALYGATDPTGSHTATINWTATDTSSSGVQFGITNYSDGGIAYTCNVPSGTNPGGCNPAGGASSGNGTWSAKASA